MGNVRRLSPGEILAGYPGDAHNAFLDTYKRVFGTGGPGNGPGVISGGPTLTVEVINMSGALIDADFPILKLTKPVFTTDDNENQIYRAPVFEGTTPDADTKIDQIAVVQGPIGDENGARIAIISGPTWCDVNVTNSAHTHVLPTTSDNTVFTSGTTGARIIWKAAGTGIKRALVLLGGGSAASENYRLIYGLVKGDVTADDTTFVIDAVAPLAGGLDPVSGNPVTEITVQNVQKESFEDNTRITAIYDGANWETVVVERYRSLRGQTTAAVSTSDTTFTLDNIVILDSGVDPRTDPTSAIETVTVHNIPAESHADNEKVWADFNVKDNRWEARPKGGGSSGSSNLRWARVYSTIGAATGPLVANWGGGQVKLQDNDTGAIIDLLVSVDNLWIDVEFGTNFQVVVDTGHDPPRVAEGTCAAVEWGDPLGGESVMATSVAMSSAISQRRNFNGYLSYR